MFVPIISHKHRVASNNNAAAATKFLRMPIAIIISSLTC